MTSDKNDKTKTVEPPARPKPGEPRDESALESLGRSVSEVITGPTEDPARPTTEPAQPKSKA